MADEQSTTPEQPAPREAPLYGELAPEGWEWKPPSDERASQGEVIESSVSAGSAGGSVDTAASSPVASPGGSAGGTTGRIAGVPHNLGATPRSAGAGAPTTEQAGSGDRSYRAPAPSAPPRQPAQPRPGFNAPTNAAGPRKRSADRTSTIILIAFGALGALYFAFSLQQMPASFAVMAQQLGANDLLIPDSVKTISTVGALAVLVVYALNVVLSLQRMRAGKLAFWVPLVAFGVALAVLFGCSAIALSQMPQLLQLLSDPGAVAKLFDSLGAAAK